ncbi:MAG TPA: hypothetical protein VFS66_03395 [Acidimicrobiia bacterium]|nr:hypothetical protein [Acidimicrobiia bacterium]
MPTRSVTPSEVDLFMFSASAWLLHRIHYDRPFTVDHDGHPELLIHGPLQGVYLVQTAEAWLGDDATLEAISYRHLSPAYLGDTLECGGRVVTVDDDGVDLELSATKRDGTVTTTGRARMTWRN